MTFPRLRLGLTLTALATTALPAFGQTKPKTPPEVESVNMPDVGPISVRELASGLEHPWGMAFLPDGRLLVTERAGRLRVLNADNQIGEPVEGVPEVFAKGQGGLLDVALDPDFENNRLIYLSYAKPGTGSDAGKATTALGRGTLNADATAIDYFHDIFVELPYIDGEKHFGSRIVFGENGQLFLTLGERFQFEPAQDLGSHLGSVIRIMRDGSVPDDNPFVGRSDAMPEIFSYGHRNIQAAAIDPSTGQLWVAEMGPLGGDELNAVEKGKNYGWPVVSWGMDYDGSDRPDPPTRPEFKDAVTYWKPVISPNGMLFYTGDKFPAWKGRMLIGGLSAHDIVILKLGKDDIVIREQRVPLPERVRDLEQAPDGTIYVLTDRKDGNVWRLEPLVKE